MRKLIVSSLVSLDGIHADPQSWVGEFFDEQAVQESLARLLDSDAMLMGRNTYERRGRPLLRQRLTRHERLVHADR